MNRLFSFTAIAAVTLVIALAISWFTTRPFAFNLILVASGVLASAFVLSIGKADPSTASATASGRLIGAVIRVLIGALVIVCMTLSALWFAGFRSGT